MGGTRLIEANGSAEAGSNGTSGGGETARRWAALLVGLAWIVSCPGCASYQPTRSGYLSDYAQLQKDPIHLNYGLGLQRANSHNATPEAIEPDRFRSYRAGSVAG